MLLRKLTLLAVALLFSLPTVATAGDIDVRAGSVRVNTSVDGDINVESGRARVNVGSEESRTAVYAQRNQRVRNSSTRTRSSRYYKQRNRATNRNLRNRNLSTTSINNPTTNQPTRRGSSQRVICSGNGSSSIEQNSQITGSGRTVVQRSNSTNTCR